MKKLKTAIISLTSCQGCEFALLDLGQRFFELERYLDFIDFKLVKDNSKSRKLDLTFIEGNPTTEEQSDILKKARAKSKILIVLGNCAAMGGVWKIKNYHQPSNVARLVYRFPASISNPKIKAVEDVIKVDFTIPTCPVNAEEFLQLIYDLLAGKKLKIAERPVCYECQINQSECLLQQKKLCFGPWIKGGGKAICLKGGQPCWGCRGLLKDVDREKMFRTLEQIAEREEILKQAEVFGLRDDLEK